MKQFILLISGFFLCIPLFSQEMIPEREKYEVTAGFGMLIYQSAYNLQNSFGIEAAVRSKIKSNIDWQAGLRLGLDPVLPEFFGRVLAFQQAGAWRPEIGLELGYTNRTYFDDGAILLQETRKAMQTDISSFYMAIHTAPLAFEIRENWKLSLIEVDFGTHFSNFGRTLRAQVMIISAGYKF